jgi:hypothetical protein
MTLPTPAWRALLLGALASTLSCGPSDKILTVDPSPPAVALLAPEDGGEVAVGEVVTFQAQVLSTRDPLNELSIRWSSDLDGTLNADPADGIGVAQFSTAALSGGDHVITVEVTDSALRSAEDFIRLTVSTAEQAPAITLRKPNAADQGVETVPTLFEVLVSDEQDEAPDLLVWFESDLDGVFCEPTPDPDGLANCDFALSVGEHTLTFGVIDSDDNESTVELPFTVISADASDDDLDGYTEDEGDCNDADPSVQPGATEYANDVDDDCDGEIDEGTNAVDDDGDGFSEDDGDCDDGEITTFPGALEVCDGVDNDCDLTADETTSCFDDDGDGYTELESDCDDADASAYPSGAELPDTVDNDCDGVKDEGTTAYDDDGDCACEISPCTASVEPTCTTLQGDDCDDADAAIFPGATELCDSIDNDCDGTADPTTSADAGTWYRDADGDTYGDLAVTTAACALPAGYAANSSDCDDSSAAISPADAELCDGVDNNCSGVVDETTATDALTWYLDADSDTYGTSASTTKACTRPSGYSALSTDCNDSAAAINPAAVEKCDLSDNDCDATIDESDAVDASTWYLDVDGDNYGLSTSTTKACSRPSGYASVGTDCNDGSAAVSPAATEICDLVDNDCDSSTDEGVTTTYYRDADSDGYGSATVTTAACSAPSGYVANATDCNDSTAAISPADTEVCDGVDNNCSGAIDEASAADALTWYLDADSDTYGTSASSTKACTKPSGYSASSTDCNDGAAAINPAATELCDLADNDCDSTIDESDAADASTWYKDTDGDGYGLLTSTTKACSKPTGYVSVGTDCNDGAAAISPAGTEVCDYVDNDCDTSIDESVTTLYYRDADGDGYGTTATTTSACSVPSGYVTVSGDCDDGNASLNPATVWYRDADGDTYGLSTSTKSQCAQPSGYVSNNTDCNDSSASAYPGKTESCDGIDNDCDGSTDEINATGCTNYYIDADGDGYGISGGSAKCYCSATGLYTATTATDCYDSNANANPGATAYYSTHRGDGSYDYNCDSAQSKYYTTIYSCTGAAWICVDYTNGWTSSAPSCGSSSTWRTGCSASFTSCTYSGGSARTQTCR